MARKQNIKAIDDWQSANVERILIKPNKRDCLSERIQQAIDAGKAKSRQSYIISAVKDALDRDGIPAPDTQQQPEE